VIGTGEILVVKLTSVMLVAVTTCCYGYGGEQRSVLLVRS
jgi:hypothetical protein